MQREFDSAVKVFEGIEKLRRGMDAKLTHLGKNRRCLACGKDFMPKRFESCPECHSENTRLMRQQRKCLDCEHMWKVAEIGACIWCGSLESEANPKDDLYIRNIALPRLKAEEDFYEKQMRQMVEAHPVWKNWAKDVKGAGLTTVGRIIGKTDITRLNTVSEMWAHAGWGLYADGTRQRKRAGEPIDYDAHLQSNCVILAENLIKTADKYHQFFAKERERWAAAGLKPGHVHNRAFRHMIKLFLAHFWEMWRIAEGLPAPRPYAFAILHHPEGHYITPQSMTTSPREPAKAKRRVRGEKVTV